MLGDQITHRGRSSPRVTDVPAHPERLMRAFDEIKKPLPLSNLILAFPRIAADQEPEFPQWSFQRNAIKSSSQRLAIERRGLENHDVAGTLGMRRVRRQHQPQPIRFVTTQRSAKMLGAPVSRATAIFAASVSAPADTTKSTCGICAADRPYPTRSSQSAGKCAFVNAASTLPDHRRRTTSRSTLTGCRRCAAAITPSDK